MSILILSTERRLAMPATRWLRLQWFVAANIYFFWGMMSLLPPILFVNLSIGWKICLMSMWWAAYTVRRLIRQRLWYSLKMVQVLIGTGTLGSSLSVVDSEWIARL